MISYKVDKQLKVLEFTTGASAIVLEIHIGVMSKVFVIFMQ